MAGKHKATLAEKEKRYHAKAAFIRAKKAYKGQTKIAAFVDWMAVFAATVSFVFIVLWAAAPDSAQITAEQAILRALSYGVPITLGMWGIARATRSGSAVPGSMARALPYARLGKDGKVMASDADDDAAGIPPTPIKPDTPVTQPEEER